MTETTLSKTAHAAELLAASILLHEVIKDVEVSESFREYAQKSELLAIIVISTFKPAEA